MDFGKLSFSSTMGEGAATTGVGVCRCSGVMDVDADAALFLVAGSALVEREGSFLFLPSMFAASLVDSGIKWCVVAKNASRPRWCKVLCLGGVQQVDFDTARVLMCLQQLQPSPDNCVNGLFQ